MIDESEGCKPRLNFVFLMLGAETEAKGFRKEVRKLFTDMNVDPAVIKTTSSRH